MEVARHDGLEVVDHSPPEGINGRYRPYDEAAEKQFYSTAGTGTGSGGAVTPKNKICGLSRAIFWLAAIMAVLALGMIGLGVGLGVALSKSQNANADTGAPTTPTSPASAISSPSSTAQTSSAPESSASTSTSTPTSTSSGVPRPSNICPGANNTIVTPSLGSVRYRVACDSDFGGDGKATLSSVVTTTWDECLGLCNTMNYFQKRADVGATWNVEGTGTQTPGTCWCLGGADKTVTANKGNVAAVPQSD